MNYSSHNKSRLDLQNALRGGSNHWKKPPRKKPPFKLIAGILVIAAAVFAICRFWPAGGCDTIEEAPPVQETPAVPAPPPPPPRVAPTLDYSRPLHSGDLSFPAKKDRAACSSTGATAGCLVDLTSGRVLWAKNPKKAVPIASMVKMMTMLLTAEELENNPDITLDTEIQVTDIVNTIAKTGIIYLDKREKFPLKTLLMAVTIKSANDAAMQLAEFLGGGDSAAFVDRMNSRAAELGMTNTIYYNACGLKEDGKNSLSSPADLVILAEEVLEHDILMDYAKIQHIRLPRPLPPGEIDLSTTNKLINPQWPGVDGLKTGFTNDAGSCLTVTCIRNGRRLVGVVTGYGSAKDRDRFCRSLLDWGYEKSAAIDAAEKKTPKE